MIPRKEYKEAIWVRGKKVYGCSNCFEGAYKRCPDAYSDVAYLCGNFSRQSMPDYDINFDDLYKSFVEDKLNEKKLSREEVARTLFAGYGRMK